MANRSLTVQIAQLRDSRSLATIEREEIDEQAIHGFVVDFDNEWLLVKKEFDFHIDGWLLLRIADVTRIDSSATNEFQKSLLQAEGTLEKVDFTCRLPRGGVVELLATFGADRVVIFEKECEYSEDDDFYIGFVRGIDGKQVRLDFFDGVGKLDGQETLIDLDEVTSISYDSSYTLHYERYFSRLN